MKIAPLILAMLAVTRISVWRSNRTLSAAVLSVGQWQRPRLKPLEWDWGTRR